MSTVYSFSEINFFIVVENQFVRTLVTELLNQFKPQRIYTESNFSVAIDRIPDIAPDIIFAGWTPFTDSIKLFKAIRFSPNESLSETPIIAVTSYSEKQYVIAARDLGMNEYLTLPLSANQFTPAFAIS